MEMEGENGMKSEIESSPVKIVSLEMENVKRVQAVNLEPAQFGLTVIGGNNRQGKTSILDGIAFALGGEKFRPTNLQRDGGMATAAISVTLSNGLVVERKGKNAALKVTDPSGTKGGQKLLDTFVEALAIDLPKFLSSSGKEKGAILLRILGIEDKLAALDKEERAVYDERTVQGRVADDKEAHAKEMPEWHDVGDSLKSADSILAESQEVARRNAALAERRAGLQRILDKRPAAVAAVEAAEAAYRAEQTRLDGEAANAAHTVKVRQDRVAELQSMLDAARAEAGNALELAKAAHHAAAEHRNGNGGGLAERAALLDLDAEIAAAEQIVIPADEPLTEIEDRLAKLEEHNGKVRANMDKAKALEDAEIARGKVSELTSKVEDVRRRRKALLDGAGLPLPELGIEGGELTYNGKAWDCMSTVEMYRAGVAIVRRLKPACGFVLLDKLEAFDKNELAEFGQWLGYEGLQGIATRVSRGEECSIIIEDGLVVDEDNKAQPVKAENGIETNEQEW